MRREVLAVLAAPLLPVAISLVLGGCSATDNQGSSSGSSPSTPSGSTTTLFTPQDGVYPTTNTATSTNCSGLIPAGTSTSFGTITVAKSGTSYSVDAGGLIATNLAGTRQQGTNTFSVSGTGTFNGLAVALTGNLTANSNSAFGGTLSINISPCLVTIQVATTSASVG